MIFSLLWNAKFADSDLQTTVRRRSDAAFIASKMARSAGAMLTAQDATTAA
jgi:hypothetical protein